MTTREEAQSQLRHLGLWGLTSALRQNLALTGAEIAKRYGGENSEQRDGMPPQLARMLEEARS